ncbi:BspA family leucine-rich repeat surface protein [Lactococcus ileimucosae]|uniref:BspA family leucine-rich repeat surface protein n=1 Tax=Lactococcus ileimucosae TaxID=2941329 RepID=UPI0020432969|nr:BspA family leucine-rich repeat surface protein [Lactococcus ileimucosae]
MKIKKSKKTRVGAKRKRFLTVATLVSLIGSSLFQSGSILATTLSREAVFSKDTKDQPLNGSLLETPNKLEFENSNMEVKETGQPFDSVSQEKSLPAFSEVKEEDILLKNEAGALEISSTAPVPTQALTVWGNVAAVWNSQTSTLTITGGTITNSTFFEQPNNQTLRNAIEHIVFEARVDVGTQRSLARLFLNMRNLIDIENFNYLDTTHVTNMTQMFNGAGRLTHIDLSNFDTRDVTDMSYMFSGAISLSSLDVSGFETDRVTDMENMFGYTHNLREIKGLDSFKTHAVTNMAGMFWAAQSLESLDVSSFDTGAVTDMSWMYANTHQLENLDLKHFKTGNVRNMSLMFAGARDLKKIDLGRENFDTSAVTNMSLMFAHTHQLESLDLRGFNTAAVTNMSQMFFQATALKELDLSSFKTPALTNAANMFQNATALTKIDISSFDTSRVSTNNRNNIFAGVDALLELRLGANTNIMNTALPNAVITPGFLNSWKRDTQRGPADWLSSQDLMTLSESVGQATGTWRRVPYQTNVQVKDSQLVVGDVWQASDNFISATDREGNDVDFAQIQVGGDTVDTSRVGSYNVTYTFDGVTETAQITVKADQTSIQVKDSQLAVGDSWKARDNFVAATNRYGTPVLFEEITIIGSVDTTKAGVYHVTYIYHNVEEVAQITVRADESENGSNGQDSIDTNGDSQGNGAANKEDTLEGEGAGIGNDTSQVRKKQLPETGEIASMIGILGLTNLGFALRLWLKRRKEN